MRYANDLNTFTHTFALSFPERRRAKKMDNQSKMQLYLLDMEQHELLLIAVAHKFRQLKTHNHRWWVLDIIKNRLKQGAYHNLVKELQFDKEKFQQYFRLTREQFDQVLCYTEEDFAFWHSCLSERKHPTLTSYSRITKLPPFDFVPFCRMNRNMERFSLPHTQPFAAARQIACRIRTYWNHPRPFTCFSIFAG